MDKITNKIKLMSPNKRVSGSATLRPNLLTQTSDTRQTLSEIAGDGIKHIWEDVWLIKEVEK